MIEGFWHVAPCRLVIPTDISSDRIASIFRSDSEHTALGSFETAVNNGRHGVTIHAMAQAVRRQAVGAEDRVQSYASLL